MTHRFAKRTPLVLSLGTIAAGGAALTGCGDPAPTEAVYNTPAQCIEAGVNADICNAEYQEALQSHLRDAPKFNGQAACEAEYGAGKCLEQPTAPGSATGSFFVPFMTGYLISSAISNLTNYGAYRNYRRDRGYAPVPVYTNRSGATYRSDPPAIGRPPQQRPFNVNTRTVSRQGFGGSAATRGFSFGG